MTKQPYCKNCRLFDERKGECAVIILHEGQKYNLPVSPNDHCFFDTAFVAKEPVFDRAGNYVTTKTEVFKPEVQEVKFWVEDPNTGKKTKKDGVVKMQYPEGFFGKEE
jgi:hypothetical protein